MLELGKIMRRIVRKEHEHKEMKVSDLWNLLPEDGTDMPIKVFSLRTGETFTQIAQWCDEEYQLKQENGMYTYVIPTQTVGVLGL